MSTRLDDYAGSFFRGVGEAAGDLTRSVIADVGDTYQRFLMADATPRPPQGLTGTMETVSYEMERAQPGLEPEPEPPPEIAAPESAMDVEH
jgi:hypothetical protein